MYHNKSCIVFELHAQFYLAHHRSYPESKTTTELLPCVAERCNVHRLRLLGDASSGCNSWTCDTSLSGQMYKLKRMRQVHGLRSYDKYMIGLKSFAWLDS
jgi:hypothetical protein